MEAVDRSINQLLDIQSSSNHYNKALGQFFKTCIDCLSKEREMGRRGRSLGYVGSALGAQMKRTSNLQKHTAHGIAVATATWKLLRALRKAGNITRENIMEKLGEEGYNDLIDRKVLSEIIEQRAIAEGNKQLWLERVWLTAAKLKEPEYMDYGVIGGLVMAMLTKEADDEGSCEGLLKLEQENREMVLGRSQVTTVALWAGSS